MIVAQRQQRPGACRGWVEIQRKFQVLAGLLMAGRSHSLLQGQCLESMIPGAKIRGMLARCAAGLRAMDLRLDAGHDSFSDLLLHEKDVSHCTIVALSKQVVTCSRLDQLDRDAELIFGTPCAAFDQVGRSQLAPYLFCVLGLAFVDKG